MVNDRLNGKNIVITGASGGIGAEMATLCAEAGARLILMARSIDKLAKLKAELESRFQAEVLVYKLDVSDTDAVEITFSDVLNRLDHIDILVNNAGFGIFREAHESSIEEIKSMFEVNVVGLMACTFHGSPENARTPVWSHH